MTTPTNSAEWTVESIARILSSSVHHHDWQAVADAHNRAIAEKDAEKLQSSKEYLGIIQRTADGFNRELAEKDAEIARLKAKGVKCIECNRVKPEHEEWCSIGRSWRPANKSDYWDAEHFAQEAAHKDAELASLRQQLESKDKQIKLHCMEWAENDTNIKKVRQQLEQARAALEHCRNRPHEHNPSPDFTITQCEVIDRAIVAIDKSRTKEAE